MVYVIVIIWFLFKVIIKIFHLFLNKKILMLDNAFIISSKCIIETAVAVNIELIYLLVVFSVRPRWSQAIWRQADGASRHEACIPRAGGLQCRQGR